MSNRVRISVGSDPDELELVDTVIASFCERRGLAPAECGELRSHVQTLALWLIERAYPDDPTGEIVVQLELAEGEVRVTFEDWGEPIASFGGGVSPVPEALSGVDARTADLRLVNLGREGKRLSFALPAQDAHPAQLARFGQMMREVETGSHSADEIEIRDGAPGDGEAISRLLFTNYGLGYGHPEFYEPNWVIERLEAGTLVSTVAVAAGELVGHHALMTEDGHASAESGVAVVHPAYRGFGLFGRMFEHTTARARGLGLHAVYGRAVTNHVYSQKSEISHGYLPSALMLGAVPNKGRDDVQMRGATLVSFLTLERHPRAASLASRYADQLASIYANLGLELAEPAPGSARDALARPGVSAVADDARETSVITVTTFGDAQRTELLDAIRHTVHRHDDVAYCDLDLHSMTTPELDAAIDLLREYDYFLCGLMPFGAGGHDRLRLQAVLTDEVELDDIQLVGDFPRLLHDWVFSDR